VVVHGHSIRRTPQIQNNRICVDTEAYYWAISPPPCLRAMKFGSCRLEPEKSAVYQAPGKRN